MSTNNSYGKEKVPAGKPEPLKERLGVMIPGMGAVATTLIAGVEAVRRGPISSTSSDSPPGKQRPDAINATLLNKSEMISRI